MFNMQNFWLKVYTPPRLWLNIHPIFEEPFCMALATKCHLSIYNYHLKNLNMAVWLDEGWRDKLNFAINFVRVLARIGPVQRNLTI